MKYSRIVILLVLLMALQACSNKNPIEPGGDEGNLRLSQSPDEVIRIVDSDMPTLGIYKIELDGPYSGSLSEIRYGDSYTTLFEPWDGGAGVFDPPPAFSLLEYDECYNYYSHYALDTISFTPLPVESGVMSVVNKDHMIKFRIHDFQNTTGQAIHNPRAVLMPADQGGPYEMVEPDALVLLSLYLPWTQDILVGDFPFWNLAPEEYDFDVINTIGVDETVPGIDIEVYFPENACWPVSWYVIIMAENDLNTTQPVKIETVEIKCHRDNPPKAPDVYTTADKGDPYWDFDPVKARCSAELTVHVYHQGDPGSYNVILQGFESIPLIHIGNNEYSLPGQIIPLGGTTGIYPLRLTVEPEDPPYEYRYTKVIDFAYVRRDAENGFNEGYHFVTATQAGDLVLINSMTKEMKRIDLSAEGITPALYDVAKHGFAYDRENPLKFVFGQAGEQQIRTLEIDDEQGDEVNTYTPFDIGTNPEREYNYLWHPFKGECPGIGVQDPGTRRENYTGSGAPYAQPREIKRCYDTAISPCGRKVIFRTEWDLTAPGEPDYSYIMNDFHNNDAGTASGNWGWVTDGNDDCGHADVSGPIYPQDVYYAYGGWDQCPHPVEDCIVYYVASPMQNYAVNCCQFPFRPTEIGVVDLVVTAVNDETKTVQTWFPPEVKKHYPFAWKSGLPEIDDNDNLRYEHNYLHYGHYNTGYGDYPDWWSGSAHSGIEAHYSTVAISPTGMWVTYIAEGYGGMQLYGARVNPEYFVNLRGAVDDSLLGFVPENEPFFIQSKSISPWLVQGSTNVLPDNDSWMMYEFDEQGGYNIRGANFDSGGLSLATCQSGIDNETGIFAGLLLAVSPDLYGDTNLTEGWSPHAGIPSVVVNNNLIRDPDDEDNHEEIIEGGYGAYPFGHTEAAIVYSSHGDYPGDIYIIEADYDHDMHRMDVYVRRLTSTGGFIQPKVTEAIDFYYNTDYYKGEEDW